MKSLICVNFFIWVIVLLFPLNIQSEQINIDSSFQVVTELYLKDSSLEISTKYLNLLLIKKDKGALKRFVPVFVRRFGTLPEAELDAAKALTAIGKIENAGIILERRYNRTGKTEDLLAVGRLLTSYGSKFQADAVLIRVLELDSTCAEVYYLQSQLKIKKNILEKLFGGRDRGTVYNEALELGLKAVKFDTLNPIYTSNVITLLDSMERPIEACSTCSLAAIRIKPDLTLDRQCGLIYFGLSAYSMTLFHFERAYLSSPTNIDNLLDIEKVHKHMGTWRDYYLTAQERLADAMPETLSIRYNLAIELITRDSIYKAEKMLQKVLARDSFYAEANKAMAALLVKNGRPTEALPYMQRQQRVSGRNTKSDYAVGQMLLLKGDTAAAVAQFERVVETNPKEYNAAYFLAVNSFNNSEWERVVQYVTDPDNFIDKTGAALMLGTALFYLKQEPERAFRMLKRCEGTDEADESLYLMLANLAFDLKYYGEAAERYKKCILNYPESTNEPYYQSRLKESLRLSN
ncbi:MAG: hypothetical protein JNL74_10140 [Fibrobacteres bacterium]|nr:hypothetical protein [Fibrobacterota bacterium]